MGLAALVHSNLKSPLSEPGEKSSFSGKPGRKGCAGSSAKLPDGAIRKLLHKALAAGNLLRFSGNSFAQVAEEETKS